MTAPDDLAEARRLLPGELRDVALALDTDHDEGGPRWHADFGAALRSAADEIDRLRQENVALREAILRNVDTHAALSAERDAANAKIRRVEALCARARETAEANTPVGEPTKDGQVWESDIRAALAAESPKEDG